jgi:ribosomal protein L11 methyltransferase
LNKFYYELKITPAKHYELYLDLVLSLTSDAIEELEGSIILRSEESLDEIVEGINYFSDELSNALNDKIECETIQSQKENEDWIAKYKDAIKPVTVGKFHIHPSWEEVKEDKINILIDPALAFGSGHHETTSSCLGAISAYVKPKDTMIDVGSGSGILAIGASKLGAICDICDTDSLAVENALENFKSNNATLNDSWVGSAVKSTQTYDVVVANIVADVLVLINKDLKKVLKDDGILILSGILENYLDKVMAKFEEFDTLETISKNEWRTLVLKRKND